MARRARGNVRLYALQMLTWKRVVTALVFALAAVLVACGSDASDSGATLVSTADVEQTAPLAGQGRDGPARSFGMGFLALPAQLSEASYLELFDIAAERGDLLMIQRAVPWAALAAGGAPSAQELATADREAALSRERGLDLLFAIDPWEPTDRGRLAGEERGPGFDDPAIVESYLRYVEFVVERYQPRWIALAVDVDQFAAARPEQLDAFQAAYIQAYRLVKERLPQTSAFLSFQLEDLQGLVPWGAAHDPQWGLVIRFAPFLDLLAVSSFPSFVFPFQGDIPEEYFSRLAAFGKPVAMVPVGYASEPGRDGVTFGNDAGQRAFLERLLREAEDGDWELVVWLAPQDPGFEIASPYDLVARMGLRDEAGAAKVAWNVWTAAASRPWSPLPRDSAQADGEVVEPSA
jgi:hypothetical protein